MIYEELKKKLFTKYVLFSIIGIIILTIGLNVLMVGKDKKLKETMKQEAIYCGKITEDKLWMALKKVRDEKSKETKYQPLISFIYGLTQCYRGTMYSETRIEEFKDEYAKNFYKCWEKKSLAIIEKIPKENQEKAVKELNKVKTPFVKFQRSYFWSLGMDNLQVNYLIIIFMVMFFASTIYSESIEDGSMEIILTTKFGKKSMALRILPVIIYGLLLTLTSTIVTMIFLGSITGFETLKSSLRVISLFAIGNFTLKDGMFLMFVSEVLGIMASSVIMSWVSLKTGKTKIAISIGVAINILYIINLVIKIPGRIFKIIFHMFPLASSQIIYDFPGFRFDFGIWRPYIIMINMAVMFALFSVFLIHAILKEDI